MKTRCGVFIAISLLIILAFSLAACEKDRPAPTPTRSAASAAATAAAGTPQANVTTMALPTEIGGVAGAESPAAGTPEAGTAGTGAGSGSGEAFEYTVEQGDTLANIARKYGVSQAAIVSLNALANPDLLSPGQKLKIPAQAAAGSTAPESTTGGSTGTGTTGAKSDTYTVQAGDTLSNIAQRFGVTRQELQAANSISNADQIYAGQVLRIPGAVSGSAATSGSSTSTPSGSSATATPATGEKIYVVQRGDTLAGIAAKYGVTIAQLKQANNIANADQIYSGQKLTIP